LPFEPGRQAITSVLPQTAVLTFIGHLMETFPFRTPLGRVRKAEAR
jgi:hypothetical protein